MAKALRGKILFKIHTLQKETYALTDDINIHIARGYEFNLRLDKASMGYCIDGEGLKEGDSILIHHNATHDSNFVPHESFITDEEFRKGWRVFSIDVDMCYASNNGNGWNPYKGFLITERLFKPYEGKLHGIPHEQIKNRLLIVKGTDEWDDEVTDLSGKVMAVTENSDYQVIWHSEDHKEQSLIRTRTRELLAIDNYLTNEVNSGRILVGLNEKDCKPIKA